jgi:hypothetical protein
MSSIICTSAEQFRDWSADYRVVERGRFDRSHLFGAVVDHLTSMLSQASPLEVAVDDTTFKKSGRRVAGAQWRPDRTGPKFQVNLMWGVRFLQISAALPSGDQVAGPACMVPVDLLHCPVAKKPSKSASTQELAKYRKLRREHALPKRAAAALERLRARVDPKRPIICSGDGGYTNRTMFRQLPENVAFIGRIRKDAKLFAAPQTQNAHGRRRVYGDRLPTPDAMRIDDTIVWQKIPVFVGGQMREVEVKSATVRWKPAGAKDLHLVIIRPLKYKLRENGPTLYRDPVYLISTELSHPLQQIVQSYIRRWGIEQNFRDEKQVLGVSQSYVRTTQSVEALPALIVAAYAMLRLACRQSRLSAHALPKWRRPGTAGHLTANQEIALLRCALWGQTLTTPHDEHFSGFVSSALPRSKPPKFQNRLASAVLYAYR